MTITVGAPELAQATPGPAGRGPRPGPARPAPGPSGPGRLRAAGVDDPPWRPLHRSPVLSGRPSPRPGTAAAMARDSELVQLLAAMVGARCGA